MYSGLQQASETMTVTGTVLIRGRQAFVIRYGPSLYNEGLENYWSTSPDGDVLLHGFNRSLENFGYVYDPPIVLLDAPLAVGSTWTQTVNYYALPDTTPAGTFTITFGVFEAGALAVPAGTFYAYGIGQAPGGVMVLAGTGTFSVTGRRITSSSTATDWWAEGVGRVKYASDQEYQLESFTGPTGTDAITWGGLKALYRR
ncbi:MAG TPA: hypothetical protein VGK89_14605 [Candidatus Eisenbacteria bacterium]|jgi:hypothetical protein